MGCTLQTLLCSLGQHGLGVVPWSRCRALLTLLLRHPHGLQGRQALSVAYLCEVREPQRALSAQPRPVHAPHHAQRHAGDHEGGHLRVWVGEGGAKC